MFERFSDRARQVVVDAQDEARGLNHNYIGTEHLLLGLLRAQDGVSVGVLNTLGVTREEVRLQVLSIIGQGDEVIAGQIPFTPRAKKVLELSLREALGLGHSYIGTEHLLLAIARENDGVGARILIDHGADADKIRMEVARELGMKPPRVLQRGPRRTIPAPHLLVVTGWMLFAAALGVGILVGWAIWG